MFLSKYKPKKFQAVRRFTDRREPTGVFTDSLEALVNGSVPFKVLVYYGMGGIGKTTLLTELRRIAGEISPNSVHQVSVSLDAFEFNSPTDILLAIRSQLKIQTLLFDFALIKYWAQLGHSSLDIKKRLKEDSVVWEVLNYGAGLIGGQIPVGLINKAFNSLRDKFYSTFSKHRDDINIIENAEPLELFRRLPYFLGLGIQEAYEKKGITHVFFLDAYETMLRKLEDKAISQPPEEWIQELIGSSEKGLFVIGSREYIKWGDNDPAWNPYIDQHILGSLSDKDAEYFLDAVPIKEKEIKNEIIKTANGIPLYLDLCVSIYEKEVSRDAEITPEVFQIAENEVVDRFLRHLDSNEQELVKLLSVISIFDYKFFSYIIESFSIGFSKTNFKEFVKTSIISEIDQENRIYKIDESIRGYVQKMLSGDIMEELTHKTVKYLIENKDKYNEGTLLKYYGSLCRLHVYRVHTDLDYIEDFLEISFHLLDKGCWQEMGKIVALHDERINPVLLNTYQLIESFYVRKTQSLQSGLQKIGTVDLSRNSLGKYANYATSLKVDMIRMAGDYNEAEGLYKSLANSEWEEKGASKLYIMAQRHYAHIKFLKGDFKKALALLEELAGLCDKDPLEYAETLRYIGHLYRWNWMHEKAESSYKQALRIVQENKNPATEAKIYSNLAETYCWFQPEKAMEFSKKSVEQNGQLQSKYELGIANTSMAIASYKSNPHEAAGYVSKAIEFQTNLKLKSGILFALIARGLLEHRTEAHLALEQTILEIEPLIEDIKVFKFLMLPFLILQEKEEQIHSIASENSWLDFEHTLGQMRLYLNM